MVINILQILKINLSEKHIFPVINQKARPGWESISPMHQCHTLSIISLVHYKKTPKKSKQNQTALWCSDIFFFPSKKINILMKKHYLKGASWIETCFWRMTMYSRHFAAPLALDHLNICLLWQKNRPGLKIKENSKQRLSVSPKLHTKQINHIAVTWSYLELFMLSSNRVQNNFRCQ